MSLKLYDNDLSVESIFSDMKTAHSVLRIFQKQMRCRIHLHLATYFVWQSCKIFYNSLHLIQSQNSSAYGWKIVNYLYQAWLLLDYFFTIIVLKTSWFSLKKNLTSLFLMSKYVRNAMIQILKKVFLTDFVISGCSFLETSKRNGDENWNVSELLSFDTYGFLIH